MKINLFKICILFSLFMTVSFAELNTVRAFPNLQFDQPVDLQSPNDNSNRIFILEQEGEILVFQNLDTILDATQFLDIRDKIEFQGEMGLLGLAFHPDYGNNGYFYVNYIAPNPRRTVIARYEVSATDSNTANNESEMIILEIDQPYNNHNGGQIAFGSDGFLYIGMGDGGSGGDPLNHGQNLSTLHGAMLRIDINNVSEINNYVIPVDNPYVNNNEGNREEIYAHGFRNPWRFSFDDYTGNCWIADVGQDEYEEISILEHGGNYGWNIMEGFHCFNPPTNCDTSGLVLPIYEYDHSIGESITGGHVYRGTMLPSLIGKYIFADFEYGDIYALEYNDANNFDVSLIGNLGPYSVTSFGVDQNNEIYICKLNGEIYKFIDESSQNCTADDGTSGIELWGTCYSIQNTENLYLSNSGLSGTIPTQIGELTNLESLYLTSNNFTGEIPASFGNLINLEELSLSQNQISGIIPTDLQNLTNLKYLDLSYNSISGNISDWIGGLNTLEFLSLSHNNITGSLPHELGQITSLVSVELDNNQLSGEFPQWISNLNNLIVLELNNNNLSGNIPDNYCDLPNVSQIDVRYNNLCPPYPDCLADFENQIVPQYCENIVCPESEVGLWGWCYNIEATTIMRLYNKDIVGEIPAGIGELENLERLDLRYNQLSGEIPPEIGNLTNLLYLQLNHNQLTGEIPPEIGNLINLQILMLNDNSLSGQLPESMANLVSLSMGSGWMLYDPGLSLSNNNFSGEIPSWIGNFENLRELDLSGNQFSGIIPEEIGNLSNLLTLKLNDNLLTEDIPNTIYQLNLLDRNTGFPPAVTLNPGLDISNNQLSGIISNEICNFSINWSPFVDDSIVSYFNNNNFCPPYPSCIENSMGTQDTTNCGQVSIINETLPITYNLYNAYPNPFNPFTVLRYDLPKDELVTITVYDMLGNAVKNLVNANQSLGHKSVQWNATNYQGQPVSAGVYLYSIEAGEFRQTKKMILLK